MPGLCPDLAVVDASAELLLRAGQQHREGVALGVFEVDTDRVAALIGEPNVGDGTGTDLAALVGERSDARVDDIGRCRVLVVGVGSCGDHLGLAVGPDRCRVGEELAACVELLLGELDGDTEQTVEVVLRLGEALSRQEVTNQLTWVQRRVSWRMRCWSSGSSCPIASR